MSARAWDAFCGAIGGACLWRGIHTGDEIGLVLGVLCVAVALIPGKSDER